MASYKKLCYRCKKNYVPASWKDKFVTCYDCTKKESSVEIQDPKMKELFNIPEDYYKENSFLRSIKLNYIRYNTLTERQIEAFKETVKKLKNPPPKK